MSVKEPIVKEEYEGMTIKIFHDEDTESPRITNSNLGHMVYWHRRYIVGDEDGRREYDSPRDFIASLPKGSVILPVFMFDHSGVALKTTPFNDKWDSGKVGYICVSPEKIRKEYGVHNITRKTIEKVKDVLRAEVSELGQWMNGEVYGYVVEDEKENHVHSCWGYYGIDICLQEARIIVDGAQEQKTEMGAGR